MDRSGIYGRGCSVRVVCPSSTGRMTCGIHGTSVLSAHASTWGSALLLRGLSYSGDNCLKHVPEDLMPFPGPHGESTPAKGNRGQEKNLSLSVHRKEAH